MVVKVICCVIFLPTEWFIITFLGSVFLVEIMADIFLLFWLNEHAVFVPCLSAVFDAQASIDEASRSMSVSEQLRPTPPPTQQQSTDDKLKLMMS